MKQRGEEYDNMTWNYRVTQRYGMLGDEFEIREVFYDDGGEPGSWTSRGMAPFGESPEDLREDLELMLKAFDQPVLVLDDLEVELARRRSEATKTPVPTTDTRTT